MRFAKKLFALSTAICMAFCFTACGGSADGSTSSQEGTAAAEAETTPDTELMEENEESPTESRDETTDILVAYFSATGNTKTVAENIAKITGGDLYEIVPAEAYTEEDLDYGNDQSRTSLEMNDPDARPEISSEALDLDGYSVLYLGYPIWHGRAPRIMDTFVEQYDFDGLTIIPFCTSGGSGIGSSAETLEELAGSGSWLEGQRFSSGVSEEELQEWIENLQ